MLVVSVVDEWRAAANRPFSGWSFEHMNIREEKPPWSYPDLAARALEGRASGLDLDTGGGEMLASLRATWPSVVTATEAWRPNLPVAAARLRPLGAQVVGGSAERGLPFADKTFEVVVARHAFLDIAEVRRVLTPGGVLVTQQVGPNNHRDLRAEFGISDAPDPTMTEWIESATAAGFDVDAADEWSGATVFGDVGALVQFLGAVPWTIPDFDVDKDVDVLQRLHDRQLAGTPLTFEARRWYAVARRRR